LNQIIFSINLRNTSSSSLVLTSTKTAS